MPWKGTNRTISYGQWQRLRRNVLARDNNKCVLCGRFANEVDHITPKSMGGLDAMDNLQSLCPAHHKEKTLKEIQAGKLRRSGSRIRTDSIYKGPRRSL